MIELLPVSIGIGLITGVFFSELFGLAAGGMIVPGYFAIHMEKPLDLALTFSAALITLGLVKSLSAMVIVYGRRRTAITILIGYLMGALLNRVIGAPLYIGNIEYSVIGFIIPGLIAIWMDRQGILETFCSVMIASITVRLILIVFFGREFDI